MDRATALQIFGAAETAQVADLQCAYWRLRSHIEERLRHSGAIPKDAEYAARIDELVELERALEAVTGSRDSLMFSLASHSASQGFNAPKRLWLSLVAGLGLLAALGFGLPDSLRAWLGPVIGGSAGERVASELETAMATLEVASRPKGAAMSLREIESGEMIYRGSADGPAQSIAAGRYNLEVAHPKCDGGYSGEIGLQPGENRVVIVRNCQDVAWLVVRSDQPGDALTIDGRAIGESGLAEHPLAPGDHEVWVEKQGYTTWQASVSLTAAQQITLLVKLSPLEAPPRLARRSPPQVAVSAPAASPSVIVSSRVAGSYARDELGIAASWHRSAKQYLLSRFDSDRSGLLDTPEEVESVPCSDWLGLEDSFDGSGLALSMTKFFGFDGSKWIEESFGVSQEMRSATFLHLKECGVR